MTPETAWKIFQEADCLYTEQDLDKMLDKMAVDINKSLAGKDPIVVCVLKGGIVPFGQLLPKLNFPLQLDYLHVSRYGNELSGGDLHWLILPKLKPKDRTVLLIDDILDEGNTLYEIERRYLGKGAKEVYKAVLAMKDVKRKRDVKVDFPGVTVPDRYIFGFGMDYKGYLRNLPGIYAENEKK